MAKAMYVGGHRPASTDEHTLLLLHGESLVDSSGKNVAITNSGVTVSNAQSKFGGSSLYFDGSSNLTFSLPTDCFAGKQDWTVDWWEYRLGTKISSAVFYKPLSSSTCGMILCDDNGQGTLTMYESSNGSSHNVASAVKVGSTRLNQWVHRAIVKVSGIYTAYENGVKVNSLTYTGSIPTSSYPMHIGNYGTSMFYGYIDEFRISNVARWVGDFTVPTKAYEVDVPAKNNVALKIKRFYIGVNGVARFVKKAYIGVNGVARLFWQSGMPLSELPHGALVKINEGNLLIPFYLAEHDYESSLNGAGRILMVRQEGYQLQAFDDSHKNGYPNSTLDTWFNNDYLTLFSDPVREAIGTTKFYCTAGNGSTVVTTYERAVFTPSVNEMGACDSSGTANGTGGGTVNIEGSVLTINTIMKPATLNGSPISVWTRSIHKNSATTSRGGMAYAIVNNGSAVAHNTHMYAQCYSRPAFTLPCTMMVNPEPNADGSYSLLI